MSVSLHYATKKPVGVELKQRIHAEARAIERDWVAESILFYDRVDAAGPLTGDTKLFTPDPADAPRAGEDARVIVDRLCAWSEEHGLTWSLNMAGADIGEIADGRADPKIMTVIEGLIGMGDVDFSDPDAFV